MSELGGSESFAPGEDGGGVSEAAREQAAQRFAASQQAAAQQQKDEKKAKKRDDGVAQMIVQFLSDLQRTHLATLIARLIARDCPSTFVLAILSLINDGCKAAVEDYLREKQIDPASTAVDHALIPTDGALTDIANEQLAAWIVRMDLTLQTDQDNVLKALIVDDQNIDGTVLQLTSFVLQEFLKTHGKEVPFEQLQQLAAGVLQTLFTPHMHARMQNRLSDEKENDEE